MWNGVGLEKRDLSCAEELSVTDVYSRGCNMLTQHMAVFTHTYMHVPVHTLLQLVHLSQQFSSSEKSEEAPQVE